MRIAFLRRGCSSTGGAEKYLLRLMAALEQAGHQAVLCGTADWPPAQRPAGGFHALPGGSPQAFARAWRRLAPQVGCDVVFSLERATPCDVFRAGDGLHAAWLQRRAPCEPAWRSWLHRLNPKHRQILALEREIFQGGTRRVIANSDFVRGEILRFFPDYPADAIRVVRNGLPPGWGPAPHLREATRRALGLAPGQIAVLFTGTGWVRKGLPEALRAIAAVAQHGYTLLVAGRGPAGKFASPHARFLGPVAEMPPLYAAADLFLLPTHYDPFSNATLEALAGGLPVITSDANGCAEILTPETGSVAPSPARQEDLVAALLAWRDPARLAAARPLCAACAAPWTMERNLQETLQVLTDVSPAANSSLLP